MAPAMRRSDQSKDDFASHLQPKLGGSFKQLTLQE
jgi:hypothetical protein